MNRGVVDGNFPFLGFEKIVNGFSLMGGIIISDEMNLSGFPEAMGQPVQAVHKEGLAFFEETSPPGQTVMDPKAGHEMGDAVADIFMFSAFDLAGFHRQGRKAAFQGLDRGFLVKANDKGIVLGEALGLFVVPEDGGRFFEKIFSDLGLPIMIAMRLKFRLLQDLPDRAVMDLGQDTVLDNLKSQITSGPMRQRPVPLNGRHTSQRLNLNSLEGGKSGVVRRDAEDPEGPQGRVLETAHGHPKPWSGRSQRIGRSRRDISPHGIKAESVLAEVLGVPFCET